jgi:hypothetical protein
MPINSLITSDSPLFQRGEKVSQVEPLVIDESNTETRFLPRSVQLVLPGHVVRKFPAGLQEVPVALLDHPWLKANGMVEYKSVQGVPPPRQPTAPLGSHAYAMAYAASGTYDATLIPDPYVTDEVLAGADANARAAADMVRAAQETLDNAIRIHQGAVAALEAARAAREKNDADARSETDADTTLTGGSSQVTPSQRKALQKLRADAPLDPKSGEASIGIDKLEKKDRAVFDAMSVSDKAKFIQASDEERAVMLAANRK